MTKPIYSHLTMEQHEEAARLLAKALIALDDLARLVNHVSLDKVIYDIDEKIQRDIMGPLDESILANPFHDHGDDVYWTGVGHARLTNKLSKRQK